MKIESKSELKEIATQVRRDIIRMVSAVQSGHPGGSLGCADLFTALYFNFLNHSPSKFSIDGKGEDLFFLSNGHISPVWYSVLARSGYFPIPELNTFRKIETRLQGHPATKEHLPGIRVASGSLGQGLSVGIGAALSKKLNNDPNLVITLMGDGEVNEGQVWEAAFSAPHLKVDNLIGIIDLNGQQIDGPTKEVLELGDLGVKFKNFGWEVLTMNGHDFEDLLSTLNKAKSLLGKAKPVMIIMETVMGKGVDYMEGTHNWHGKAPNAEQTEKALNQLKETKGDF